jgi:peroxin-6
VSSCVHPDIIGQPTGDPAHSPSQSSSAGYRKLLAFTSAALTRNAAEFGLQVSIALKGARGTGKMTAASQVARELGLHLFEVYSKQNKSFKPT